MHLGIVKKAAQLIVKIKDSVKDPHSPTTSLRNQCEWRNCKNLLQTTAKKNLFGCNLADHSCGANLKFSGEIFLVGSFMAFSKAGLRIGDLGHNLHGLEQG